MKYNIHKYVLISVYSPEYKNCYVTYRSTSSHGVCSSGQTKQTLPLDTTFRVFYEFCSLLLQRLRKKHVVTTSWQCE